MARRKKADKGSVKVNFKGVESRQTPPEGDYKVKVLELTTGQSANKNDQIEGTFEIAAGQYKGVKLYMYFPLQENSLWKLHAFLTALGEEVPEDEMDIDLSDLVDKEFVGVVTHETYNGRKRAKLTDFDSIDNYSGDDDEKDGKGKKGAGKKDAKKSKKVSRSDVEDMDEDELQELLEEHDLEDEVDLDDHKKLPKKVAAVIEALEEADLLEDEDDDEDEKPAKGKGGKKSKKDEDDDEDEDDKKSSKKSKKDKGKKKPKKIDRDDVEDMDEDALQELIDEHELDVDLDDFKKIGKKREAVIDALEDEDLLEDE
jgi:hypothetical protein